MLTQLVNLRRMIERSDFTRQDTVDRMERIDDTNMSTNFLGRLVWGWMEEISYLLGGGFFLLCAAGG